MPPSTRQLAIRLSSIDQLFWEYDTRLVTLDEAEGFILAAVELIRPLDTALSKAGVKRPTERFQVEVVEASLNRPEGTVHFTESQVRSSGTARLDRSRLGRLLGQRGVSAAQISRIEAGEVDKPSVETLVALPRELDFKPVPLMILAGHIAGDEASPKARSFPRGGIGALQGLVSVRRSRRA